MTPSVISIDSIILNSMSTDSKVSWESVGLLIDPHSGRDAVSLSEQDTSFLSLSPTGEHSIFSRTGLSPLTNVD